MRGALARAPIGAQMLLRVLLLGGAMARVALASAQGPAPGAPMGGGQATVAGPVEVERAQAAGPIARKPSS